MARKRFYGVMEYVRAEMLEWAPHLLSLAGVGKTVLA